MPHQSMCHHYPPPMVWAYWKLLHRERKTVYALLFLSITGALYTHYFAALTALFLGIFHVTGGIVLLRNDRRCWLRLAITLLAPLIAFLPWLAVLLRAIAQASSEFSVRGINSLSTDGMVKGLLYLFSNGSTALLILILFYSLRRKLHSLFTWCWFALVLGALILINARLGVILEIRYMLALWPALAILVGLSLNHLRKVQPFLPLGILGIWVVSGLWMSISPEAAAALSNPHWHLPWREFRKTVETRAQPGDAAVFVLPDWTWAIYHGDEIQYYLGDLPLKTGLLEQPGHIGAEPYQQKIESLLQNQTRLWSASTPQQPLSHLSQFESIVAQNGFLHCARVTDTNLLHVDLYAQAAAAQHDRALEFSTPARLRLIPAEAYPATVDEILSLTFIWNLADPAQAAFYSVAFHLQDEQGRLVAQTDEGIPAETNACRLYEFDTHALPSGNYTLLATVYRWENGSRLPLVGSDYEVLPDGRIILARLRVEHNTNG